jgi:SAM-dependent methyltransferase
MSDRCQNQGCGQHRHHREGGDVGEPRPRGGKVRLESLLGSGSRGRGLRLHDDIVIWNGTLPRRLGQRSRPASGTETMAAMKVTGERVASPEAGFNPTWQRHVAAYKLSEPHLSDGRVLDLGCGVGHSFHLLAPRETVGVDIDPGALAGQERETVVADMRELPFPDGSFASVLSVQSLEHVPDPDRVVDEVCRVLSEDGVAVFITPNRLTLGRPDEIIDPYHYVEFDPGQLRALCEPRFEQVQVLGVFGSERYMAIFDEERATLDKLLGRDPLRLRRLVPMRAKQKLYDLMLNRYRGADDPRAAEIDADDFELRADGLADALDLCAICRRPRR